MFYVDEFLESLRDQRCSQKTIGAYRSRINHLKEYLEEHGVQVRVLLKMVLVEGYLAV